MITRNHLHRLVDALPEEDVAYVGDFLAHRSQRSRTDAAAADAGPHTIVSRIWDGICMYFGVLFENPKYVYRGLPPMPPELKKYMFRL